MNALDIVRKVEMHGGHLELDGGKLRVSAPTRLPDELMAELGSHKLAIMVALGEPLDTVVSTVLEEIRPHLTPSLQQLPDERLLALVNWNIITAWEKAARQVGVELATDGQHF